MLSDIEFKQDIEIIYAADCGPKEWSLNSYEPRSDICFVYIRNNKQHYGASTSSSNSTKSPNSGHFFGSNDKFSWAAYDITDMTDAAVKLMYPFAAEILFASNVYKKSDKYPFVEQMRRALLEHPRVADLVQKYRSMARSTFTVITQEPEYYRVSYFLYMSVIREVAMIEWLKLKFISERAAEEMGANARVDKLVETNFNVVLDDLRPQLNAELYSELKRLVSKAKNSHELSKQARLKRVDEWIVLTTKESYDLYLQALANEAHYPKNVQTFVNIWESNLKLKFDAFNAINKPYY